jgi:hypothetical protein
MTKKKKKNFNQVSNKKLNENNFKNKRK